VQYSSEAAPSYGELRTEVILQPLVHRRCSRSPEWSVLMALNRRKSVFPFPRKPSFEAIFRHKLCGPQCVNHASARLLTCKSSHVISEHSKSGMSPALSGKIRPLVVLTIVRTDKRALGRREFGGAVPVFEDVLCSR